MTAHSIIHYVLTEYLYLYLITKIMVTSEKKGFGKNSKTVRLLYLYETYLKWPHVII